jgi:hypothetical protein
MGITRKPAAAGRFYPRFKPEVQALIDEAFLDSTFGPGNPLKIGDKEKKGERMVLGGISPHAGYVYSGSGTAHTIQAIFEEGAPDTVIILGNQHTGYHDIGLMKEGDWETPLGRIPIDTPLANDILKNCPEVKDDDAAFNGFPHGREHNIEVQIPFIQYAAEKANKPIKIVTIKIGAMNEGILDKLGKNLAKTIQDYHGKKDIAIIASSDMTHYEPRNPMKSKPEIFDVQHKKDGAVIDAFKKYDIKATFANASDTTVCGPQTIATLMTIGKALGYPNTKALKYYTSFEKMGQEEPCEYSVGYFSGIITK